MCHIDIINTNNNAVKDFTAYLSMCHIDVINTNDNNRKGNPSKTIGSRFRVSSREQRGRSETADLNGYGDWKKGKVIHE